MKTKKQIDAEIEAIVRAPYRRELLPNEDGTWFARIGEFPGCMTEGDTQADALAMLDDAMREWLRAGIEEGHPIPPPDWDQHYSGKFVVRGPPALHRDLAESAARQGVSLNAFVTSLFSRAVGVRQQAGVKQPRTAAHRRRPSG